MARRRQGGVLGWLEGEGNNVVNRKTIEQRNFQCLEALNEFMAKLS